MKISTKKGELFSEYINYKLPFYYSFLLFLLGGLFLFFMGLCMVLCSPAAIFFDIDVEEKEEKGE